MTDPALPDVTPAQPAPKPHWARRLIWPLITVTALFVGIGIGGAGGNDDAEPDDATTSADVAEADETTAAPAYTPPPEPTYPEPVLADFALELYETEKQCFGSAGCNVTFTVDLAYGGPELDPTKTYELRYEIAGAEDPLLSTLEIQGDSYTSSENFVSTANESDELAATILDIRER